MRFFKNSMEGYSADRSQHQPADAPAQPSTPLRSEGKDEVDDEAERDTVLIVREDADPEDKPVAEFTAVTGDGSTRSANDPSLQATLDELREEYKNGIGKESEKEGPAVQEEDPAVQERARLIAEHKARLAARNRMAPRQWAAAVFALVASCATVVGFDAVITGMVGPQDLRSRAEGLEIVDRDAARNFRTSTQAQEIIKAHLRATRETATAPAEACKSATTVVGPVPTSKEWVTCARVLTGVDAPTTALKLAQ